MTDGPRHTIDDGAAAAAGGAVSTHAADTTGVHGIADTTVLETQTGAQNKANSAASGVATALGNALAGHAADTTDVHGIADTTVLETQTGAQAKANAAAAAAATAAASLARLSRRNLAGGRMLVATRLAGTAGTLQPAQNLPLGLPIRHVATEDCSDLVLGYGAPLAAESDGSGNPVIISTGVKIGSTTYPATFSGQETGRIDPGGRIVLTDPIPVSLTRGDVFYTVPVASTDSGATTLAAAAAAGDTTIQLNALPGGGRGYIGRMAIEGPREVITVRSYSGTSAPYTATLAAGLGSAHALNAVVGGTAFANITTLASLGEFPGGNASTTLAQAAAIGDATIKVVSLPQGMGTTWTVDGETLTVRTITGAANPYTVYLVSPLTAAHAQGAFVGGQTGAGVGFAPTLIAANYVRSTNPRPPVIIVGDSIPNGTGYYLFPDSSYITDALNAEPRAYIRITKAGESAQQFAILNTSIRRRTLLSMGWWVYFTYGVNDVYGSRTLAQFQADATTILTEAKNRGLKVAMETLPPRTNTIDDWTTTGGQTIVNAGTHNQVRIQVNNWIRAGAGGLVDLPVERADAVETARDSGLWKVGPGGPYTMDGIHLSYAGHKLLQPVVAAALAQMV